MSIYTTNTTAPIGTLTIKASERYVGGYSDPRGIFGNIVNTNTIHASGGVVTRENEVSMEDLNSDVFNTPMDTLTNLWLTRYGNEWVNLEDVMDDEFYGRVYKRLRSLGELEVHFLTDRARYVCRKPL